MNSMPHQHRDFLGGIDNSRTNGVNGDMRTTLFDRALKIRADGNMKISTQPYCPPEVHTAALYPTSVGPHEFEPLLFQYDTGDTGSHLPCAK
jgi:hypothetical protein